METIWRNADLATDETRIKHRLNYKDSAPTYFNLYFICVRSVAQAFPRPSSIYFAASTGSLKFAGNISGATD
jgi:hypothetical protein